MTTITISKEIIKKRNLVIIPREEYEEFLEIKKAIPVFAPTVSDKKALAEIRKSKNL